MWADYRGSGLAGLETPPTPGCGPFPHSNAVLSGSSLVTKTGVAGGMEGRRSTVHCPLSAVRCPLSTVDLSRERLLALLGVLLGAARCCLVLLVVVRRAGAQNNGTREWVEAQPSCSSAVLPLLLFSSSSKYSSSASSSSTCCSACRPRMASDSELMGRQTQSARHGEAGC